MATCADFHSQLASIMEVLANAAVAEICQLVDDGFATLRLEISRSQRENLALKSRLRLMKVRSGGEQSHRENTSTSSSTSSSPPLLLTGTRTDHHCGGDGPAVTKRKVKCTTLENTDTQHPQQPAVVTEQPEEPEVVVIKKERLEEELTGCSALEDHQTAPHRNIGPPSLSLVPEGDRPLSAEAKVPRVSASARDEKEARAEAQQQVEKENQYCPPAEQSHKGPGPDRGRDMSKEEDSLSAESVSSKAPDVETSLMKTLDSEPSNAGVKSVCGAAADWRGVKLKTEASWAEALRTQSPLTSESVSNSLQTESEAAQLDTGSLDSCSFDELFSSPEVARSLTAPHKHSTDLEEPLSSASFSFLSTFGTSSVSDSSFSNASSDSRSRSFPGSAERAFSCQQCGRVFSASRDLLVHQRSHAGERIYHCHLCKKPFVHPHQLKTHQRVHTGEKPFSCTQCGKRFSQSSHIKRHMSVHTGEKRYSCSLCGKRFSQACSLKVHQAVHTGERPYSCTKCGKSFSVLGNLVRHQSVHVSK
ncbi:uncharacterized protein ABDE67_014286 [Symphorus nematophorus]